MIKKNYTDTFRPPTEDIKYNISIILNQDMLVSVDDLKKAHGTIRVYEAVWELIEQGEIEYTECYGYIRKRN